jgi:hypothetical protein
MSKVLAIKVKNTSVADRTLFDIVETNTPTDIRYAPVNKDRSIIIKKLAGIWTPAILDIIKKHIRYRIISKQYTVSCAEYLPIT